MAITSFAELGVYINSVLNAAQKQDVDMSPHGPMWTELQYVEFVEGNVPGVTDPISGDPMPILVRGRGAESNIILALQGAPGTPFDPNTGGIGRMPVPTPYFTEAEIQPIIDWIDAGCPE